MKEVTPEIQAAFTNELLTDFAAVLDKALKENLSRISPKVPSQTIQAIRYEIMKASASDISAKMSLIFQDSARISEMREVTRGKMVPVDVIRDWVKKNRKSLQQVPGYEGKPQRLSEAKQIDRIAWAVAMKQRGYVKRKAKAKRERTWLNPTFYGFVNRLISDFQRKQTTLLQQMLKDGLSPLESPQKL